MQIFISHSSADAEAAANICETLERHGSKCFIAPRDIRSGREYAEELLDGIDRSAAVILLMSENANHSPHVLREVERAVSKSIPILVYKLEEVTLTKSMEYFLMTHQWVNARSDNNYVDILRFADDLKKNTASTEPVCASEQSNAAAHTAAGMKEPVSSGKQYAVPNGSAAAAKRQKLVADGTETPAAGQSGTAPAGNVKNRRIAAAVCCVLAVLAAAGIFIAIHNIRNSLANTLTPGDTVTFGSYNGEPINWRVLKIADDKKHAVLVSADVLTMKAYDAPEGGRYNWYDSVDYWSQESEADTDPDLQVLVRGNNIWSTSNIRTWLNCADEVVNYTDQPPHAAAMAERRNGYEKEAGFLHDFTDEELAAITETENVTKSNILYDAATVTTTDRVYLLSLDELQWFDEAGISKYARPTDAAVEQDESCWWLLDYNTFHVEESCWWLREPVEGTASKCYLVNNGYTEELLRQENAGLEGFGIRPAITVDLRRLTAVLADIGK